ncbi:hypothetical protein [Dongia sp.]|uniref:hypothetical protein n=1 Tax=Dongia sp. TaxID=1977262 RepID=UPI0035B4C4E7
MTTKSRVTRHRDGSVTFKFSRPITMSVGAATVENILMRFYIDATGTIRQRQRPLLREPKWPAGLDRKTAMF